jgi:hypothetical protein
VSFEYVLLSGCLYCCTSAGCAVVLGQPLTACMTRCCRAATTTGGSIWSNGANGPIKPRGEHILACIHAVRTATVCTMLALQKPSKPLPPGACILDEFLAYCFIIHHSSRRPAQQAQPKPSCSHACSKTLPAADPARSTATPTSQPAGYGTAQQLQQQQGQQCWHCNH